ncbi:hypothetical protein D3C72_1624820 [compost metagenome]
MWVIQRGSNSRPSKEAKVYASGAEPSASTPDSLGHKCLSTLLLELAEVKEPLPFASPTIFCTAEALPFKVNELSLAIEPTFKPLRAYSTLVIMPKPCAMPLPEPMPDWPARWTNQSS